MDAVLLRKLKSCAALMISKMVKERNDSKEKGGKRKCLMDHEKEEKGKAREKMMVMMMDAVDDEMKGCCLFSPSHQNILEVSLVAPRMSPKQRNSF